MSNQQLNVTTKSWDIIASRVYSGVNANLTLEASGPTANLLIKTNGNVIVTAGPTGNVTFTKPPICSVLPVIPAHLVNKQYADSLIASGSQGPQGAQGSQGIQGPNGLQGIPGNKGSTGNQGAQGPQGSQGANGAQGAQGAQGSVGGQGSQGSQGANGAQGAQGFKGSVGGQGPQGLQGSVGGAGPQGFQGPDGGVGPQGFQGPVGTQGTAGTNLTLSSGNNTSVSQSGNQGQVSLTASLTNVTSTIYATRLDPDNIKVNSGGSINFSASSGSTTYNKTFSYDAANSRFIMNDKLKVPLNLIKAPATEPSGAVFLRGATTGRTLFYVSSSEKYKTNIQPLPDSDVILNVRPAIYNYKDKNGNPEEKKYIGFIAEEMAEDERGDYFVYRDENTGSIETVNYELLAPLYASATKALKSKVIKLENDLEILKESQKLKRNSYLKRIIELENLQQI